jgi:hypothetical protein
MCAFHVNYANSKSRDAAGPLNAARRKIHPRLPLFSKNLRSKDNFTLDSLERMGNRW